MTEPLQDFVDRAMAAATAAGMACQLRPDLTATDFRGGTGEDVLRGAHLPLGVVGVVLGRVPVLFGRLPDVADAVLVQDAVRRYRNQGVVARSHLSPEQALDLQLWLLAAPGSEADAEWRALALGIERDDRVARKLVWRPPAQWGDRAASFAAFVGRTFMARPWEVLPPQGAAQLDRLSALVEVAGDLGVASEVLHRWFDLAESDELEDGPDLVDALIEAWPELAS